MTAQIIFCYVRPSPRFNAMRCDFEIPSVFGTTKPYVVNLNMTCLAHVRDFTLIAIFVFTSGFDTEGN
jgi:hypothetical protein